MSNSESTPPLVARRRFLCSVVPVVATVPVVTPFRVFASGPLSESIPRLASTSNAPDWVQAARSQIPATHDKYFQTAGIAPSPIPVIDRVKELLDLQNQGPVNPEVSARIAACEPELREHFGRMFGADANEIALTHSTSEGINIVSWSLDWKPGDEVILSNQEHPANTIPWYNLARRFGVVVRRVDLTTGTDFLDEMQKVLTGRTRLVSIPHVSRNNGRRLRASEIAILADRLRSQDIRLHLDGAQGPGCVPVNFRELGCDYYSACGHKWLLGPKGTGALFCRRDILDRTLLSWTGAHSHSSYDADGNFELLPEARRFEFGTRALADFGGFDAALSWCEDVGIERILDRVNELVAYAEHEWVARGHRVTSPTTNDERSGVFVLELPESTEGWAMYETLRVHEATYTSPVDGPRDLRVAIHFFNTREEIDATFDTIERLA